MASDAKSGDKCQTCGGTGWNPAIREKPVHIEGLIDGDRRALETLHDYLKRRLCCPDCGGNGKRGEN
jgi:rubredoxin